MTGDGCEFLGLPAGTTVQEGFEFKFGICNLKF
jgi:hypothetical protein